MRGGRRVGAGRPKGRTNRKKSEIAAERALKELARAAREEKAQAREEAAAARWAEKQKQREEREAQEREKSGGKYAVEVLPPLDFDCPPDIEPLDFLKGLYRNPALPLGFRASMAVAALPYAHAKPVVGLKDARRLDAFDDDGDDEIAQAMRS